MPEIGLGQCQTELERQLWHECPRLESQIHGFSAALDNLPRAIDAAVRQTTSDTLMEAFTSSTPSTPPPRSQKAVMAGVAAKARCFRRALSDEARRRAVDRARELGALPDDFDEWELPWEDPETWVRESDAVAGGVVEENEPVVHETVEKISSAPDHVVAQPRGYELPVDILAMCHRDIPTDDSEYDIYVGNRLARILARSRGQAVPPPGCRRAPTGITVHAGGEPAVAGDRWFYGEGLFCRSGGFYRYPGLLDWSFRLDHTNTVQSYAQRVANQLTWLAGPRVAQAVWTEIGKLPGELHALALIELDVEYQLARRVMEASYSSVPRATSVAADSED